MIDSAANENNGSYNNEIAGVLERSERLRLRN
jgi:hypothetical protein